MYVCNTTYSLIILSVEYFKSYIETVLRINFES